MEFAEGSAAWRSWSESAAIESEHALFFSAMTYGAFQFRNRVNNSPESRSVTQLFERFRHSALNSRIVPVDSEILDAAAAAFAEFATPPELENSGWMLAYIELATAAHWDLIPITTDKPEDKLTELKGRMEVESWSIIDL